MLLDRLDEAHRFEAPPSLVDEEFNLMWNSIRAEMESGGKTFADEDTTEEVAKEEYRKIADRRVRLGLVLSEIGEKNKITVTEDEVSRAVIERARSMPGREKEGLGLLSQQCQRTGPSFARRSTRTRWSIFILETRHRDREEGDARRPLQGRRRGEDRGLIAPLRMCGESGMAAECVAMPCQANQLELQHSTSLPGLVAGQLTHICMLCS